MPGRAAGVPHQVESLAQAGQAVDAQRPGFGRDLDAALTHTPGLAQRAGTDAGLVSLIGAGEVESGQRKVLEGSATRQRVAAARAGTWHCRGLTAGASDAEPRD
jgi:hypothetical protein